MFFTHSLDHSEAPSIYRNRFKGAAAIQSALSMAISPVICEVAVRDAAKASGLRTPHRSQRGTAHISTDLTERSDTMILSATGCSLTGPSTPFTCACMA